MAHKIALILASLALSGFASSSILSQDVAQPEQNSKVLICYYGSWAVYRPEPGKFDVEAIDPMLCTHIVYGFAGLNLDGTLKILDEYNDLEENFGRGAMRRFTNLKQQNPNLRALLAIGGWNECEPLVGNTCEKYSNMAATRENRRRFIDSVVPFMQLYNFDGFDLDWEYPTQRGGRPEDKANFALLCEEMRAEFDPRGWLLTAAVSAGQPTIEEAYDVPSISRSLHYIHLMAYDFHGGWESFTHHNAPQGPIDLDSGNGTWLNVKHAVDFWIAQGCPPEKLVLGMGTYGRGWQLRDAAQNGFYSETTGLISAGPYTREPGIWGYNEIVEKMAQQSGWVVVRDPDVVGPYAHNGLQWIGYDDPTSIAVRVNYLIERGLAGGMFWSVETDDFHGTYSNEAYPMLKTAARALLGNIPTPPPPTTRDPTAPTPTAAPTTTRRPDDGNCHAPGIIADPTDCHYYITCVPTDGGYDQIRTRCPEGTIFDPRTMTCNWYDQVPGAPELCNETKFYF